MSRSTEIDVKTFMKQHKKSKIPNKNYEYLSPKEYAELMKIHPVTVYKRLKKGLVEGAEKYGGEWKIPVVPKTAVV